VDVRPATDVDAAEIAALLGVLGYPVQAAEVRRRLALLEESDAVLLTVGGMIALHRVPLVAEGGALARITALVVVPDCRGVGIGRVLLAAAEQVARCWGCDLVEVSSGRRQEREGAHRFYRAAGFEDTARRSTRYWKRLALA
jgi:GNAT superfamily N-acetyltransferase